MNQDAVFDNVYYRDLVGDSWRRSTNDFRNLGIDRLTTQVRANVCDLSIVQGPLSAAPYQTLAYDSQLSQHCVLRFSLTITPFRLQWNDGGRMMLNTDMVLAFDLGDTPSQGNPNNCGGNAVCTPTPVLRAIVDIFVDSNEDWLDAFFPAWQKMQELGYQAGQPHAGVLQEVSAVCASTPAVVVTSPPPPPSPPPPRPPPPVRAEQMLG